MWYKWLVVSNYILELMWQYATYCPLRFHLEFLPSFCLQSILKNIMLSNFQIFLYKCTKHEGSFSSLLRNYPKRLHFTARIKIYQFENSSPKVQLTYKHVEGCRPNMYRKLWFRNFR